jgi:hypothetical protein
MKLGRLRLSAIAITAALLTILFVSPALGGPSLKQWLKKRVTSEVRKQLSSKTGPAGPQGAPGTGEPTSSGSGIVARASLSGPPVSSDDQYVQVPVPLAGASWTQAEGELDEVYAEATHTGLAGSCFGGADSGAAAIVVDLPGGRQLGMDVQAGDPAGTTSATQPVVLMPSLAGSHTLTASIQDSCVGSESTTVTGIDIYVVANR